MTHKWSNENNNDYTFNHIKLNYCPSGSSGFSDVFQFGSIVLLRVAQILCGAGVSRFFLFLDSDGIFEEAGVLDRDTEVGSRLTMEEINGDVAMFAGQEMVIDGAGEAGVPDRDTEVGSRLMMEEITGDVAMFAGQEMVVDGT